MEHIDPDVMTPATRAQHLEDLMTICNQLTSLGVGQLRKSTYVTLPPAGSRASPVKRLATESPLIDSKKVTEFLDPANDGEDEDELDDEDDTTRRKEPGSPIVEKHDDPTIPQDVGKFLSEWQDLSKRIEVRMSDLAQKEQDAEKKLAILKHKEDEIAARENSLHRREKIIKKAVQDLQSLIAK